MRLGFLSGRLETEARAKLDDASRPRNEPPFGRDAPPPRLPATATASSAREGVHEATGTAGNEKALLERVGEFRESVAANLYDRSSDYQILCHLTHSDLKTSEPLIAELRKRLSSDAYYVVLAKLDEAYTIVERRTVGSD